MNLANSKNREIQDSEVFNKNVETQLSEMPSQECKTRKVEENSYDEAADFEKAITATGFGKFNILLYAVSLTAGWSSMFETTTMSYVFPAAECDLKLELKHKGLLNAVTYIGMLSSALIWGFLCDTLGRKKLLVIGFLLDAVFVIMAASSQNFAMLMTAKFFGGFIINGPFAALTTYLSEFHCSQYRARVQMVLGVIFTIGNLLLPIMAVAILPLSIRLEVGENFVIHSWNIYLFMCSLSPLISFVGFMFLPETPKFLMTTGQNEKALKVFRKVYRLNTGKSEDSYPIQKLVDETQLSQNKFQKDCGQLTSKRNKTKALLDGWQQMKPLFFRPHLSKIILVCIIQCCGMMSLNTLRLWLPQLFQAVNDYEAAHSDDASASLCDMIAVFGHKNETQVIEECTVNTNNYQVYTNSMIVSGVSILGYVMAAFLINSVGKKKLLYFLGTVGGGMAMSMYFSRSVASTVAIASLFVTLGSVIVNVILAVVVDLFPTTLRTMTVSLTMMIGRSGAATGNLIFPFLLETGCAPPFFFVGAMMMAQIEVDGPADFEAACTATGYGKFNILLLLLTVPSALAVQFESTLPSYILPAAECDLNLSLNDKGFINSAAFIGMTVGGPLWGFLLDTIGRRKMLFVGSSLLFLVSVANSFTQSYTHMAICKLLGGSLSGGIYIASVTYLQEFHALRYRARIQMAVGVIYSFVNVLMPILASFFLPLNFHVTLFNLIELHSWNLFLMATSSVSLLSAISFYFLPESPKFLMSAGKPEIALEVFQRAYKFNSGKSACLYPVVKLVEEKQNYNDVTDAHKSFGGYLKNGCMQIVPLFSKKYSPRLLLACTLLPLIHMSVNTFRLWLPQIFQSIHEYQVKNNGTTSDLCTILAVFQPDEEMTDTTCNVNLENNSAVYINSMIVEFVLIAGYSMGGVLINWCGRKRLLVILGVSSTAMAVALYFSQNIPTILALAALHRTFSAVCFDIVLTIIVVLFPTALRGTAVSLSLLVSRLFTVGGNLIFPILLKSSCEGPFSGMTAVMLVDKPADFETAIIGAGFGKCNIFLLVLTLPAAWTVQFESTLASFVNPAAECDLNLTLEDKGVITSMVFAGMILSGPLWGFLLDTLGRRKMLFIGSSIQFLVCLLSSLAQSKVYMVILKLIGGIMVGGIYVGYITYLQEFHSSRFRGRIQMIVGLIYNAPTLLLPVLASFIIPLKFHAVLCNSIELRSWNLLILVCSLGSLASAVSFYFLPESPKYLMTAGENEKALQIFQKVFSINTGNDAKSYPVKKLAAEQQPENQNEEAKTNQSFVNYLKNGWNQVSPLFREEYGPKFFLVCIIQPLSLMSVNTFRLWLPQIFQTMHDYEVENNRTAPDLCTIIGMFQYRSSNKTQPACNVKLENDLTPYVDSMITAVATMCGYIVAGIFINVFRRKLLSVLVGVAASLSVMSLYFSQNSATTLSLASLNVTFANIYFDMVLTIIVVMFPTTLRGTAVSLNMLIGRLMIVVGNLVFPRLLQARCEAPFLTLGIATLIATLLTFFLPNTESIKLQ